MAEARIRTTLVPGSGAARERLIAARLPSGAHSALILEGLPTGQEIPYPPGVRVHRIAPACLCCTGNLVLRVTLNRILRLRPETIMIGVTSVDHLDQLRSWLQAPPYDQLLELTPDLTHP